MRRGLFHPKKMCYHGREKRGVAREAAERRASMGNIWHDIHPSRINPDDYIAFIEIEKGSKNKYELDKETGLLILDRILYTSTHYPANYGFIPRSYGDDGDPLDVLVLCSENILPQSLVRCYPIGVISMLDQGKNDDKIISVPFNDPLYNAYHNIFELPQHVMDEMAHFFTVYKSLEKKETVIDEIRGPEEAREIVRRALDSYVNNFCR
jgi:inorganic pyrophosphatase